VKQGNTQGISPKAILAAATPALATLIGVLVAWAVSGEFDRLELTAAVTGLSASVLAFAGAYKGAPGNVPSSIVVASDDVLMSDHATRARIMGDPNGTA
jgi:hypothetical protein